MKFSLIVSTIGRDDALRLLFCSLAAQDRADFEVIVVDQSRADGVLAVVREFAGQFPVQHVPMSERGLSRGRNRGLEHASGELVGFPDDDCTYPAELLAQIAAVFDNRPEVDALTTRLETMGKCDTTGGPIDRGNLFLRCIEATLFIRRGRLGDLRFDEQMGTGSGTPWGADEGPDLILRMLARGLRVDYFPEIVIYHPNPVVEYDEQAMRRSYLYSCGRGHLYRKHRFPRRVVAWALFRSLAGSLLMLGTLRFRRARYYWLSFTGKWLGYLGRGD